MAYIPPDFFCLEKIKICRACDTGLARSRSPPFGMDTVFDVKPIGAEGIDLAIMPIGDNSVLEPGSIGKIGIRSLGWLGGWLFHLDVSDDIA